MRGDGKNDRHAGKRRGHRGGRLRWAAAEKRGKGQPSGLHQQGAWRCGAGAGAQRRNLLHVHGERGRYAAPASWASCCGSIISLVLGTLAGEALRIDDRLERLVRPCGAQAAPFGLCPKLCERRPHLLRGRDGHHRRAERRSCGATASVLYIKSLAGRHLLLLVLGATLGPGVIFAALACSGIPGSHFPSGGCAGTVPRG